MKGLTSLALAVRLLLTDAVVHAQATEIVVDPSPDGSPRTRDVLTKNGFFTSTTVPSVIVRRGEFTSTGDGVMLFLSFFFSIWLVFDHTGEHPALRRQSLV